MKQVILDTNMLMAVTQFKVDLFGELSRICDFQFKVCILDKTVSELENLKSKLKGRDKLAASIALQLISKSDISILPTGNGHVDDLLVEHSKEGNLIATVDSDLKKRLKKPYITLRKSKYLVLVL